MEELVVGASEEIVETPQVPVVEAPKKKFKFLWLLGGVAGVLVVIALGIMTIGGKSTKESTQSGGEAEVTTADNVYQNKEYFYQLTLPPKWSAVTLSANDNATAMFMTSGDAMLSVAAVRQQGSLEAFLGLSDEEVGINIKKTSPIKVGTYDAVERYENWSDQGVEVIGAYVKIQDMIYSFNLLPTGEKNAVTNESLLREYRSVLASFRLTDTSNLGKDWVTLDVEDWISINFPQNWKSGEALGDLKLYRDNYTIIITKVNTANSTCIFSDSPVVAGYAGDLRDKEYVEFVTDEGIFLRRYFKANQGDKTSLYFCGRAQGEAQYESPTPYGTISYLIPAKYDTDIVKEMDSIVKTLHGKESMELTETELSRGWYWGAEDQQKSGTPDDWIWQEAGRGSCWHAPNVLCE